MSTQDTGPQPEPVVQAAAQPRTMPAPTAASPLQMIAFVLVTALLVASMVRWVHNPVRRSHIDPAPLNYRININTADVATLCLLSGISTTIGRYIVAERERTGPFRTPADLDRVNRIGPVTIEKIKPYISFESLE